MRPRHSPDELRPRGKSLQAPGHGFKDLGRHLRVVRVGAVDLRPALRANGAEGQLDVLEGLFDLLLDGEGERWARRGGVPAACRPLVWLEMK